mmetsp:Transcript_53094/g.170081  ORF Transcript_53094/g.170081 Transcript_53094/m.170081 type:complete len:93 (-) Transcript_53094:14-292(-)
MQALPMKQTNAALAMPMNISSTVCRAAGGRGAGAGHPLAAEAAEAVPGAVIKMKYTAVQAAACRFRPSPTITANHRSSVKTASWTVRRQKNY